MRSAANQTALPGAGWQGFHQIFQFPPGPQDSPQFAENQLESHPVITYFIRHEIIEPQAELAAAEFGPFIPLCGYVAPPRMKPLRPLTILIMGPIASGAVFAGVVLLYVPELRTLTDVIFACGAGTVAGVVIFAPIAAALACRARLVDWLAPRAFAFQWYISLLMAVAFGYLAASVRYDTSDVLTAIALLLVFLGALAKVVLGIVLQPTGMPTTSKGGDSRPPLAPVPSPTAGHPPVLSAASAVEDDPAT